MLRQTLRPAFRTADAPVVLRQGLRQRLVSVPLAAIVAESAVQTRAAFDPADPEDAALLESLRVQGQQLPVQVRETRPGAYQLLDGHRRCAGLRALGATDVLALVRQDADDPEADLLTLLGNIHKRLRATELAEQVSRIRARHGWTLREIEQRSGLSRAYLSELTRLAGLEPELQARVADGALSIKAALAAAQLAPADRAEIARAAAEQRLPTTVVAALSTSAGAGGRAEGAVMARTLHHLVPGVAPETVSGLLAARVPGRDDARALTVAAALLSAADGASDSPAALLARLAQPGVRRRVTLLFRLAQVMALLRRQLVAEPALQGVVASVTRWP